jgi:hypothetical protein
MADAFLDKMIEKGFERKRAMVRAICFALLANAAVLIASVSLHEGGHALVGSALGCEVGRTVLMDLPSTGATGPYTEMNCPANIPSYIFGFSGFALVVPFGALLLLLRKFPERNLSFVVFGISLALAGTDLLYVDSTAVLSSIALLSGTLLICAGEIKFAGDCMVKARKRHAMKSAARLGHGPLKASNPKSGR